MDGVVKNQTYYEWLKNQPAQYQDEVLGKTRAKLFRDGGMTVERFRALQLDKHFTPLTLEQMRALEPKAFKRHLVLLMRQKEKISPHLFLHSMTKSDKAWDRQKENIINHIEKSDIVPLDLRKFDKQRLEKIIDFLLSLDEKQQNKILIIQGDNDDYDK